MNQILYPGFGKSEKTNKIKKNVKFFKAQFAISFIFFFTFIIFLTIYIFTLKNKEQISKELIQNYDIYRLYNTITSENLNNENKLFGIIEIKKINIYYPIFNDINEDLLKIAPCKFYGKSLQENGNICIAGHNYNNSMFFSNINKLDYSDIIYIFDNSGNKYEYFVTDIYEVEPSNLSPVLEYEKNSKELTLVTCNNINNKRIIVRATQ